MKKRPFHSALARRISSYLFHRAANTRTQFIIQNVHAENIIHRSVYIGLPCRIVHGAASLRPIRAHCPPPSPPNWLALYVLVYSRNGIFWLSSGMHRESSSSSSNNNTMVSVLCRTNVMPQQYNRIICYSYKYRSLVRIGNFVFGRWIAPFRSLLRRPLYERVMCSRLLRYRLFQ